MWERIEEWWEVYGGSLAIYLPLAAMMVVLAYVFLARREDDPDFSPIKNRLMRGGLLVALLAIAVLAVGNYTNIGHWPKRNKGYLNAWEFYHYYVGSKYAREIGYTGMYKASLIADEETGLLFKHSKKAIRNLDDGRYRSVKGVLAEAEAIKGLFSDTRWNEYVTDTKYFKAQLGGGRWNGVLRDKGYNGTPASSFFIGGLLSNSISTENETGMNFLAVLDPILMAVTALIVWWAFGLRALLLAVTLVGTHYMMSFSHMKGAYLRTDFIMCLVMTMCFIKKEYYKLAGFTMGYAILARFFPAVFLFGIGAKFFWDFVRTKRLNTNHLKFFATCGLTIAVFAVGSIGYFGGAGIWEEFFGKIVEHDENVSPWRIGFKQLYANDYSGGVPHLRSKMYEDHQELWWSIQACVLLLSLYLVKGLKEYEAFAYGSVLTFFLVAATYYYYIMLILPLLFFASKLEKPSRAIGLLMMYGTGMIGYGLYHGITFELKILAWHYSIDLKRWVQEFPTYYWLSWLIMAMMVYIMALAFVQTRHEAYDRNTQRKREKARAVEPEMELITT